MNKSVWAWMLKCTVTCVTAAAMVCVGTVAGAAQLTGRVTDTVTDHGIDGARVCLVLGSPGEECDLETSTDPFGFYRLRDVAPGTYSVTVTHAGYEDGEETDLEVTSDVRLTRSYELTPREGDFFDTYAQVACAVTGLQLADVPVAVTVKRSGSSDLIVPKITDGQGFAHFPGTPRGFFGFTVNEGSYARPGWESLSMSISEETTGPHMANVLLKPTESEMYVEVYGYDPVLDEEDVPLSGVFVEAVAVDPADSNRELLPAQVGTSGLKKEGNQYWDNTMAGKVKFEGMPPVNWVIRGKRLGYMLSSKIVVTGSDAALGYDNPAEKSVRLDMALQDTRLTVVGKSVYNDPEMLAWIPVKIQGLKDTHTEGIERDGAFLYDEETKRAEAVFEKILPGSYRVTAAGTGEMTVQIRAGDPVTGDLLSEKTFSARFRAEDYAEAVADADVEFELELAPVPVTLHGQIYKVTGVRDMANHDSRYVGDFGPGEGIEIRASEYMTGHIPDSALLTVVDAGEKGEFSASVIPGLYGVQIPSLEEYWGREVEVTDLSDGSMESRPWPYYQRWLHSKESWECSYHYDPGGLALSSDHDVQARFMVAEDTLDVDGFLLTSGDPTESQVVLRDDGDPITVEYHDLLEQSASVTLEGPVSMSVPVELVGMDLMFRFKDLIPGDYTYSLVHPRFEYADSFTIYDHEPPGVYPAAEPHPWGQPTEYPPLWSIWPTAQFKNPGNARFTVKKYSEATKQYSDLYTNRVPDFLKTSYTGNRIFESGSLVPPVPYEVWLDLSNVDGGGWYRFASEGGSLTGDAAVVYIGPTGGGTATVDALPFAYDLVVEGRNTNDPVNPPGEPIDGITLNLKDGTPVTTGDAALTERTGRFNVESSTVTHTNWIYTGCFFTQVEEGVTRPLVRLVLEMKQGIATRGVVKNSVTGDPVPGAVVRVSRSQGDRSSFAPIVTPAEGTFQFSEAMDGHQVYFLDVAATGYAPFRARLDPRSAAVDPEEPRTLAYLFEQQAEKDTTIRLVPLARPAVVGAATGVDRYGGFLPSVRKSGESPAFNAKSSSPYDAFNATEELTMTWNVTATAQTQSYSLVRYDGQDGSAGQGEVVSEEDPPREVWLLDLRSFATNPYDDTSADVTLPNQDNPHEVHAFLKKIDANDSSCPNVFSRRVLGFSPGQETGTWTATGEVPMWDLAPGTFRPVFMVVSRLGAVAVYELPYTGNLVGKELVGMRLPSWLSFMANALGTAAGVKASQDKIQEFLPEGRFLPLPSFKAEISEEEGFLTYLYGVDVNLKEGMDGPMSGIVGMAPGLLGLNVTAGLEAGYKGKEQEVFLSVSGAVQKETVVKKSLIPGLFKNLGVGVSLDPSPYGSVKTTVSQKYNEALPAERSLVHVMRGCTGVKCKASFMPVATKIPYVGPVILLLQKVTDFDAYATVNGLVGLQSTTAWKTEYPHKVEHFTYVTKDDRQFRRHFLGGDEREQSLKNPDKTVTSTIFDLCFSFGVGLGMETGERAGADGYIALAGDACWTDEPALVIASNPVGDWPPIKRIQGDVRAGIKAYLNLWVNEYQKEWVWKLIKIDHQFGTEPVFQWIEMNVIAAATHREDYSPVTWNGDTPQVVQDALALGTEDTAPGQPEMLLFTDMVEIGGDMALKVSVRSDAVSWEEPVTVAVTSGAFVDAAVARTGRGGWIVVWAEVAEDDLDDPFAGCTLGYAVGDSSGGNWVPGEESIAVLSSMAQNMVLVEVGDALGLVLRDTDEGPNAESWRIAGTVWDGEEWGELQELVSLQPVKSLTAVGSSEPYTMPVRVAYVDGDSVFRALDWTGVAAGEPYTVAEDVTADTAGFSGESLSQYLAAGLGDGGLGVYRWNSSDGWAVGGAYFGQYAVNDLAGAYVENSYGNRVLLAWSEGGNPASVMYGWLDPVTGVSTGPEDLTRNTEGVYDRIQVTARADGTADITARYTQDPVMETRQFRVAWPDGSIDNDRDQDGMNDVYELWVVDADTEDAIETIDQVLPGDDFDGDGYTNSEELALGVSPVNARDDRYDGDVNGDFEIGLDDAVTGLQVLSLREPEGPCCGGDVNQDGLVGMGEIIYVLQSLAGL